MLIRTKLVLASAAFWLVMALVLVGALRWEAARTRSATGANTAGRLNNFLFSVLSRSMSEKEKGAIFSSVLEAMSEVPGFEGAVVADMDSRATWSSGAMPGASAGRSLKDLIASATRTGSAEEKIPGGGIAVRLFAREPSCRSCHPGFGPWLGAVAVHARIDPALVKAHWNEYLIGVAGALGLLLAGTLSAFSFLRRALVEPLSGLATMPFT